MEEQFPYNLPIFRRSHQAKSPNGQFVAEIAKAYERGMSNPTSGQLKISNGISLEDCSPCFIWSSDSKYLAVPQYFRKFFLFQFQRVLVVDITQNKVLRSKGFKTWLQPETFTNGIVSGQINPAHTKETFSLRVPTDFSESGTIQPRRFQNNDEFWAAFENLAQSIERKGNKGAADQIRSGVKHNYGLTDDWARLLETLEEIAAGKHGTLDAVDSTELKTLIPFVHKAVYRR